MQKHNFSLAKRIRAIAKRKRAIPKRNRALLKRKRALLKRNRAIPSAKQKGLTCDLHQMQNPRDLW